MTTALSLSLNSTNVRTPALARPALRAYFRLVSRLLPTLARRQAERLFTRPPRYAGRAAQPVAARREAVALGERQLAVWQAGPPAAPAVLLAHGWGGRSVQLGGFVAPLLARGYRVVWFDQPGHGESGAGAVALPDLVRALLALAATHGPFAAAVGHSLGAAALGVALRQGLVLERVVLLSAPTSLEEHARTFARRVGLSPAVREAMRRHLEHRYGVRFADLDRLDELAGVHLPVLVVHDAGDAEVPFAHAQRLARCLPGARLVQTHGLGHYRILRDGEVVATVADFLGGGAADLPSELPRLPAPAPLY